MVPIHDYGEIDGVMFLEMRLIEGTDLDNLLTRYGPLTPLRAVAIIAQTATMDLRIPRGYAVRAKRANYSAVESVLSISACIEGGGASLSPVRPGVCES